MTTKTNVDNLRLPGVQSVRVEARIRVSSGGHIRESLTTEVFREDVYLHDKFIGQIRYLARRRTSRTDYGWVPVGGRGSKLSTKVEAITRLLTMKSDK